MNVFENLARGENGYLVDGDFIVSDKGNDVLVTKVGDLFKSRWRAVRS